MSERRVDYDDIASTYDDRYKSGAGEGQHTIPGALRELLANDSGNRILEVGCGTGYWLESFGEQNEILGVDLSRGMLERARGRRGQAHLVCGDAAMLSFAGQCIDLVYCVNAFHHFQSKEGFIHEARRLLRPTGALAIIGMDPHGQKDEWYIYNYFARTREIDLRRFPPLSTIQQWMRKRGFGDITSRVVERIVNHQYGSSVLKHSVLQKNGTSQLVLVSEDEYAAGRKRLEEDLAEAEARGETLVFPEDISLVMIVGRA